MTRSATLLTVAAVSAALISCASSGPAEPSAAPAPASAPPSTPPPSTPEAAPAASSAARALFTEAQAGRGRDTFRSTCAECHYSSEFRGSQFQFAWRKRSVGDLYQEIVRNMPEDAPGSLSTQQYVDVVTYILQLNGFPAGETEMGADEEAMSGVLLEAPSPGGGGTSGTSHP